VPRNRALQTDQIKLSRLLPEQEPRQLDLTAQFCRFAGDFDRSGGAMLTAPFESRLLPDIQNNGNHGVRRGDR
jgi:hypothetical protein